MASSQFIFSTASLYLKPAKIPRGRKAKYSGLLSTRNGPRNINPKLKVKVLPLDREISLDEYCVKHAQELKKSKQLFNSLKDCPSESMVMIDALQRTCIDYHFQEEIEAYLQMYHENFSLFRYDSLHEAALSFRLLRQEGYYVSPDTFLNFMNKNGTFMEELKGDIQGLISLYEASHLGTEEEDILDQAGMFSYQALTDKLINLDKHAAMTAHNSLKHPHHKSLAKFMSRQYITDHHRSNSWINNFQDLAGLDFKIVQSIHQKEMVLASKWWNNLGLAKELKLARNQPSKWHLWSIAILTHPNLFKERLELTKIISLIYIIDDMFDIYGKVDELSLFTDAINRWDFSATEQLPLYMKNCYRSLFDITYEVSDNIYQKHGWNPLNSFKKSWGSLCNAFLVEAKWFASGQIPRAEEYLQNAIISSGVDVVATQLFFSVGGGITNASVLHLENMSDIVYSAATVLRLCDDLGSIEENQNGYDGSYVKYYAEEHKGISIECAKKHTRDLISKAWKCLNKDCFSSTQLSSDFKRACLNLTRMSHLVYTPEGSHNLEECMEWLLRGELSDMPIISLSLENYKI